MKIILITSLILLLVAIVCVIIVYSKKNKTDNFSNNIPKIIIQTWKTRKIPPKYKPLIANLRKLNPDFKYMFFDDNDILKFITNKFPWYLSTFNNFKYKIQKIDFFRYLAIYYYGGFYLDLDMSITKSLAPLTKHQCVFPIEFEKNSDKILQQQGLYFLIGQYAFGAVPKSPFILKIIKNIVNPRLATILDGIKSKLKYVFYSTGPVLVSQTFLDYNKDNKDNKDITLLRHKHNASFGKYGKHKSLGSWKNL